jgi:hypothetical protein
MPMVAAITAKLSDVASTLQPQQSFKKRHSGA